MSVETLKNKAQNILTEKTNKIIPENIKKDIQIFDITGTLEESVKLFDTVANMQADLNSQEGDLAVVYREPVPATSSDSFDSCIFPSEVVLDEAVIDDFNTYYSGSAGEYTVMLKASSFTFAQSSGQQIRITYTSSDGITYTRTDGGAEKIDFQGTLALTYPTMWIDSIGKFILINGPTFGGFYKYMNNAYIEITNKVEEINNNYINNMAEDDMCDIIYFPDTVVLPDELIVTPGHGSGDFTFEGVNFGVETGYYNNTQFYVDFVDEVAVNGGFNWSLNYSSSDGKTYTKVKNYDDQTENYRTFNGKYAYGKDIHFNASGSGVSWDEGLLGYFFKTIKHS